MRLISVREAASKSGCGRTQLYQRVKTDPDHPRPVRDGRRALFVEAELDQYLAARVARLRGEVQA
jgi:predicted DNA-binding transcriptional regulator AlpA